VAKCALYRHFDAAGNLLYVGIAYNPFRRTGRLDGKPAQAVEMSGGLALSHEDALNELDDDRERTIRRRLRDDFGHYASKCLKIRTKAGKIDAARTEPGADLFARQT
jgi:hypothetical protein